MSLAPHQKATVDVASLRSKLAALHSKAVTWQPHPALEKALRSIETATAALNSAATELAALPDSYSPHASKIATTDILVGGVVSIREAKRKKYVSLLPVDAMGALKVAVVGQPFVTLELPNGTRIAVSRGDITTGAA